MPFLDTPLDRYLESQIDRYIDEVSEEEEPDDD